MMVPDIRPVVSSLKLGFNSNLVALVSSTFYENFSSEKALIFSGEQLSKSGNSL
jgi:hypothetical protein